MNLENIFKDAKTDWESQEYLLVDEYDEDGNFIGTIFDPQEKEGKE